jgi:4-alpha-glucanotransferase
MSEILEYLVSQGGIASDFTDAWGKPAQISEQTQKQLLSAMGYDLDDESVLIEQLELEAIEQWQNALNPVYVMTAHKGRLAHLKIIMRCPISEAAASYRFSVITEKGEKHNFKFEAVEHMLLAVQEIDGIEWHQYEIQLPVKLPLGYHQLSLFSGRVKLGQSSLIIAPAQCYIPPSLKTGNKFWGLSVQLYCIKSKGNWGIGDFSDLSYLLDKAADLGADFIGLNPIHALFPANPDACSPYGPNSRQWLNYLYIDVEKVPAYHEAGVQDWLIAQEVESRITALRDTEWVDYTGVSELKLAALQQVFKAFQAKYLIKKSKYKAAFDSFVEQGGESLKSLAVFEALQMQLKLQGKPHWGWKVFPIEYQNARSSKVKAFAKKHADEVAFYTFLQWQAQVQFDAVSQKASRSGMRIGLYRDLAVGVSDGSAETWSNPDLYCSQASIGAPPDVLGPQGQKWGLPPMDPNTLVSQQYQPIIELFRANMKSSGALRIDHVMGLLRLWWVHNESNAKQGGYVYYPIDDLLAILALESHRNKALVIGEDLGTVPDAIREKLQDKGIYSYRVFFFEQSEDGGFFSPSHYPEQSMATLTTHDMPTLSGFWHCDDLVLGKALGLYPDADGLAALYDIRHQNKQSILDSLHGHHIINENISRDVNYVGMGKELNYAMQQHMAAGASALLSLQLEDWLEMDKPVNIPGTFMEYPNWRRKLSHNLEDIFSRSDVKALAVSLTECRRKASKKCQNSVEK